MALENWVFFLRSGSSGEGRSVEAWIACMAELERGRKKRENGKENDNNDETERERDTERV